MVGQGGASHRGPLKYGTGSADASPRSHVKKKKVKKHLQQNVSPLPKLPFPGGLTSDSLNGSESKKMQHDKPQTVISVQIWKQTKNASIFFKKSLVKILRTEA